ncbi:beta-microseminoprotein-like [Notamacropus eugenii]|uniref:beta-microseminoprotein-like n=1 Tax=Notamacropus eugenii TaxID=9315 RepID=UPI003B67FEB4
MSFAPCSVLGCRDLNGAMHAFNSQWHSDCELCTCGETYGIHCCSTLKRPMHYDKKNCQEIFYKEACMITVVQKANPSINCEVLYYVG